MSWRDELALLAAVLAILLSGATIGAAVVAAHRTATAAPIDDGAIDFSGDPPLAP
jgi:hypothetical protein